MPYLGPTRTTATGTGGAAPTEAYPTEAPPTEPIASETYGGPSGVEPTGANDPNLIVTSYPATGEESTARSTGYAWTKHGRIPPSNYDREFPAAVLSLPEAEPPVERDNYFYPGPPRDYVPGSTYIPADPRPDPRIPYQDRVEEGSRKGINPTAVPGGQAYRRSPTDDTPYVSPGLGGYHDGPLSRENRPLAPRTQAWITADPREPDHYQPGSTYIPHYPLPPLGDKNAMWHEIIPSERYGAGLSENKRPRNRARVDSIYPRTNAPETQRNTGYLPGGSVIQYSGNPNRERVYDEEISMGRNPGAFIQDREYVLWLMELARLNRRNPRLAGLFGGGE